MKILITGGHLTPALAIIEHLKKEDVIFVGRKYGIEGEKTETLEYKIISDLGINFVNLTTGKLQRVLSINTFLSLFKVFPAFLESISILKKHQPNVVLSFGGYLSIPVVLASYILRIPIVIHEQTPNAGLANKLASNLATKICISWDSSKKYFPKSKTIVTGNPIRSEILKIKDQKQEQKNLPTIYVTGGNLGSHAINVLIEKVIYELLEYFSVVHQTGAALEFGDFERLNDLRDAMDEKLKSRYVLKKFLTGNELAKILSLGNLVVSRAGINTICELIYLKKPYLLIPLPIGTEQIGNARYFDKYGFGEFISQNSNSSYLLDKILFMFKNINKYKENYKNKSIVKKDASEKIIKVIKNVAKKTSKN